MYFFRSNYRLQDYITEFHFEKVGRLLFLVSAVYLYFNLNEFLVPAYKMKKFDAIHLHELFAGGYALMFWLTQLGGLVIPMILLLFKKIRRPFPLLIIGIVMFVASWVKRYIIVVPSQKEPFLPVQYFPEKWMVYKPTLTESMITLGSFILVLIIVTLLSKLFPVIPVVETARENAEAETKESDHQI